MISSKEIFKDELDDLLLNPLNDKSLLDESEISNIIVELKKMYNTYDDI